MATVELRKLIPGSEVVVSGQRCYAACSFGNVRVGFQPVHPRLDYLWCEGLQHCVGQALVKPGADVFVKNYYLNDREIDALRRVMDKRDCALFPDCGETIWPQRQIHNQKNPNRLRELMPAISLATERWTYDYAQSRLRTQ